MAEKEGKQQGIVNVNGVAAGALASVVAAFFTSRLGVAGTLIGAAVTSMMITISSAVLNASLSKAASRLTNVTTKISSLPKRGRLSTERLRTPGDHSPGPGTEGSFEDQPEEYAADEDLSRRSRREQRGSGPFARLSSALSNFGLMPQSVRRRVLVAGALAGVAATVISLFAITGIETVIGQPLSSVGRDTGGAAAQGGADSGDSGTSLGRLVGGGSETEAPSQGVPADGEQPAGEDPGVGIPGGGQDDSEAPQDGVTPAPQDPQPETPADPVAPPVEPAPEPVQPDGSAPVQPSGEVQQPAAEQ
jgi:hypothetical protein